MLPTFFNATFNLLFPLQHQLYCAFTLQTRIRSLFATIACADWIGTLRRERTHLLAGSKNPHKNCSINKLDCQAQKTLCCWPKASIAKRWWHFPADLNPVQVIAGPQQHAGMLCFQTDLIFLHFSGAEINWNPFLSKVLLLTVQLVQGDSDSCMPLAFSSNIHLSWKFNSAECQLWPNRSLQLSIISGYHFYRMKNEIYFLWTFISMSKLSINWKTMAFVIIFCCWQLQLVPILQANPWTGKGVSFYKGCSLYDVLSPAFCKLNKLFGSNLYQEKSSILHYK